MPTYLSFYSSTITLDATWASQLIELLSISKSVSTLAYWLRHIFRGPRLDREWRNRHEPGALDQFFPVDYGSEHYSLSPNCPHPTYLTRDGWIVIQTRNNVADSKNYFGEKTWQQYQQGFGTPGWRHCKVTLPHQ